MNGGVFVAAVVLASSGSCLYTDPINMPPSVSINPPLMPVWRGDRVPFTADLSDPDGDPVTLEWTHTAHPTGDRCPSDQSAYADPNKWPSPGLWPRKATRDYEVDPTDTRFPFCVWAFATDRHGAVRAAVPLQVDPSDHAPVAKIDVVESVVTSGGLSLYARVKFSGAGSTDVDRDSLSYDWQLVKKPPGSSANLVFCSDETDPKFECLSPDVAGDYEIQLTVSSVVGVMTTTSEPGRKPVTVAGDQLPCLRATNPLLSSLSRSEPLYWDPNDPLGGVFTVQLVDDDGDPFTASSPPLGIQFSWFRASGMGPMEYLGNDFPSYFLPMNAFTIGDVVRVRVEIHDRKPDAVDLALARCPDDLDQCYDPDGCTQRATWRIQYQ
jgi:hypothetical protein